MINTYLQEIMGLPVVIVTNPKIILNFHSKLVTHAQALETIGKLNMINGYVRTVLCRSPGIRLDLVRNNNSWQEWESLIIRYSSRKNGLKKTWYLIMKLKKELDIVEKKSC